MTSLLILPFLLGCTRASSDPPVAASCGDDVVALDVTEGYGVQSFSSTLSWSDAAGVSVGPVVDVVLPSDVVSFSATVDLPGKHTGFGLVAFNDDVWIDAESLGDAAWDTAPYAHWAALGGTVTAPISANTVPEGGCLRLQAAALDDVTGQEATLHVVVRSDEDADAVIDLNIAVVGDTELFAEDLEEALAVVSEAWSGGGGPLVGDVDVVQIAGDTYLDYDDSSALRSTVIDADRSRAVNVFIIQDYASSDGTLGEAGGIPGPLGLQGVDEAGVILALDAHKTASGSVDTQLLGEVIAHEVGHQLGLFHTTEADGTRSESLEDTPACPASADLNGDGVFSAGECREWDGANFMFWVAGAFTQDEVSETQGLVMRRSPVARPVEVNL